MTCDTDRNRVFIVVSDFPESKYGADKVFKVTWERDPVNVKLFNRIYLWINECYLPLTIINLEADVRRANFVTS
jgi:hypothetical protein